PAERSDRLDDADDGGGNLAIGRWRWRDAAQPEQALSAGRGVRHPVPDPVRRPSPGLWDRGGTTAVLPVRRPHSGAKRALSSLSYEYKETILKVTGVSLTLGDTPILRDLNLEIKDV